MLLSIADVVSDTLAGQVAGVTVKAVPSELRPFDDGGLALMLSDGSREAARALAAESVRPDRFAADLSRGQSTAKDCYAFFIAFRIAMVIPQRCVTAAFRVAAPRTTAPGAIPSPFDVRPTQRCIPL